MPQVCNKKNFLEILKNYLNVNYKLEVNHNLLIVDKNLVIMLMFYNYDASFEI
jgi:hypothetical protein